MSQSTETQIAILAGGCFWCIEAVFDRVKGVLSVESGYIGGHVDQPSYQQVCSGTTGHAEAVRIVFDPSVISYADLLEIFFATHDPTQVDRQGNDIGPQYRSAIFVSSDEEREQAEAAITRAAADHAQPIATRIEEAGMWWPAEAEHDRYFDRVGMRNPYCMTVIAPKVWKFIESFPDRQK